MEQYITPGSLADHRYKKQYKEKALISAEREMFDVAVPKIAEMVVEARKLTDEEFAQWKSGVLQDTPERIRPFIEKIYVAIEESL